MTDQYFICAYSYVLTQCVFYYLFINMKIGYLYFQKFIYKLDLLMVYILTIFFSPNNRFHIENSLIK